MCGITGIYSFKEKSKELLSQIEPAVDALAHRGPDHRAVFSDNHVSIGHTRLSIIDTSENGNQPMEDISGNFLLSYNGECYNHKELRKKLSNKGISFKSNSDTESVLYWLIEHGADGLKDINGFFSLALYDKINQKLLLARDRFGIKPLYYSDSAEFIAFGSELKSLQYFKGKSEINSTALSAYLHLNYIPSPFSIFKDVKKIPPGTHLIANSSGKIEMHRYFSSHYGIRKLGDKKPTSIESLLEDSVKRRLMSDVPIGCFLSGGLDSSIITGLATRHLDKLKTYTLVFKGNKQFDESRDASLVSRHFGTEHTEIEIDENDVLDSASFLLDNTDEPFADSSAIALYNLCKAVRPQIKVALSGDGGDELFAGYRKHFALYNSFQFPGLIKASRHLTPLLNKLPNSREQGIYNSLRKWKKFAAASSISPSHRYWEWAGYGNPSPELFKNQHLDSDHFMSQIHHSEIKSFDDSLKMDLAMVLEGDMLVKSDRMGMLNSLEIRVPFLDPDFVDFVNQIPANQRISMFSKKRLLKENFKHLLPKKILNKSKHGFEVPIKKWLNSELNDDMMKLINPALIKEQNLFNPESIDNLLKLLKSPQSANSEYALWSLMVFNSWWLRNRDNILI